MSYAFERMTQELEETAGDDGRVIMTYSLGYLAKSSVPIDPSVLDVKVGLGLTSGMPFKDDPNATLRKIKVGRQKTIPPWCAWDVSLVFSTAATVPANDSPDPTQTRVKRYKKYREVNRYIIKDINGKLIVNAAEQPFSQGIPVVDYLPTFCYEWYRAAPTKGFHGTININSFNGWIPGTLICLITSEECYEGAYYFWKEVIEMHADPLGWPNPVANAGLQQLVNGNLVECTDERGAPTTEIQPLYGQNYYLTSPPNPANTPDPSRQAGMQVQMADRPSLCSFVNADHFPQMPFENIGVQPFPAT